MIVFGPVNSRRFGLSLGVDLSYGLKQCNFDCVYCELKAAKPVCAQASSLSVEKIVAEVKTALKKCGKIDFLTLTANGEPSLYPQLEELILELKKLGCKMLILSNGTAVLDRAKFRALLNLDVVKLSLDSVIGQTFYRIDRALKSVSLEQMIKKMAEFRSEFKGELVMETLVVAGLNDSELEFEKLNETLMKIKPSRLDISSIDRPPAYPVKGVSEKRLEELARLINAVPVLIAKRNLSLEPLSLDENELLKMLELRPQSEYEIKDRFSEKTKQILNYLLIQKRVKIINLAGVDFYKI